MTPLDPPPPYTARALNHDDARAVADLMAAYEERVLGEVLIEVEDIEADWHRPSTDLERRSAGVLVDAELVAYAEVGLDERAEGLVHPAHWGRGLGATLARWSQSVARAHGLDRMGQSVPDADAAAGELFARMGYEALYTSWILTLPEDRRITARPLPAGHAIRDFVPGSDEAAAYQVIEDAFGEWEGRVAQSYADWAATVLGRPGFEPWQLRLVTDTGQRVVGACLLQLTEDTGWVQQIAVQRSSRGQGLAAALLSDAFGRARERGRPRCDLSTDSRTGALGLYEHVGMQVTSSFTHWAKAL